jgi:hypothetical protein
MARPAGEVLARRPARARFGGVYLFDSKADADRSRETPLFGRLVGDPALTGLTVEEYNTLAGPTAATAA